jgi:hypothetical protein
LTVAVTNPSDPAGVKATIEEINRVERSIIYLD